MLAPNVTSCQHSNIKRDSILGRLAYRASALTPKLLRLDILTDSHTHTHTPVNPVTIFTLYFKKFKFFDSLNNILKK